MAEPRARVPGAEARAGKFPGPSLIPALTSHLKVPRPDGAPTVLTIDWKTDRPEAVQKFKELLDAHAEWFSSAPKAADSPLSPRRRAERNTARLPDQRFRQPPPFSRPYARAAAPARAAERLQ